MRKKLLIFVLICSILCTFIPINTYADSKTVASIGETKISTWNFSDSFDASENSQIDKASNSGGALIAMNPEDWISYSIDVESEGIYALTVAISNIADNMTKQQMDVSVNGESVKNALAVAGKGWNVPVENYVGVITLPEGISTLTFTSTSASCYFFYFKLQRLISSDLGDAELADNDGIYGESGYLTFSENSLSYFNLETHDTGFYKVAFTAKAEEESALNISVSDETKGILDVCSDNFYEAALYCELKETDTQLKIAGLYGNIDFCEIKLYKLSYDAEQKLNEFTDELKNAKTEEEIKQAIETAEAELHPNGIYPKDMIFSMKSVYQSLLNQGYSTKEDVLNAYFKSVGEEINNPKIRLYKENEQIISLTSGKLSVEIDKKAFNILSAVVAVYEENRLKYVSVCSDADEELLKAEFSNVVLDENKDYNVKIFFFESLEKISPDDTKIFKEFYVDTSGSDESGDGSKQAPFATIAKAKETVAEIACDMSGDIIINIASGEYFLEETEVFDSVSGGKNGFNVIYRGNEKIKPEITGGKRVSGWTYYKDGVYFAPFNSDAEIRNLYVNGYSAVRAHGELLYEVEEYYDNPETETLKDGIVIYPYMFPESLTNSDEIELVFKTWWVSHRTPVEDIIYSDEEVILVMNPLFLPQETQDTLSIKEGKTFYIENALELLDSPGEFYYSKTDKILYYYPQAGEDISQSEIYVPVTETLIDIKGTEDEPVRNLYFENLDIKYGSWNGVTENGIFLKQADEIQTTVCPDLPTLIPGQVKVNYADNILIENCEFSCLGSAAIALTDSVHNMRINGNLIRDISGSGIIVGSSEHGESTKDALRCKNIKISNNVIARIGQEYMGSVGISAYYEKGIEILHNTIKETPYSAIHVGWGWLTSINYDYGYYKISNNHIEDVMCTLIDGAHIYTLGPIVDSIISNNYMKTSHDSYGGIYNDTGSRKLNIYGNVIEDVENSWSLWDIDAEINAHSNYATVDSCKVGGTISSYGGITVYDSENPPQEVESIINSAGVEDEYSDLTAQADLPLNVESIIKNTPSARIPWEEYYIPVSGNKQAEINAQYFIDTYHSDTYQGVVTDSGITYISYNKNEWVKYRINVLEEGIYSLSTLYSYCSENVNALLGVSVDETQVLSGCEISSLASWKEWAECELGNITLSKGLHEITFTVENGGFHMRSFMLNKIN